MAELLKWHPLNHEEKQSRDCISIEEGTHHIVIENRELNDCINIMIHYPGGRATGQKETKTPRSAEKKRLVGFLALFPL